MGKDTFYFSHDYNARTDEKIKLLIRKHGLRGYGIFWAIVEDLYNNANALQTDYDGIAFELREDIEVVKSVINDFNLFQFDDGCFGSLSVQKRLDERNEKSKTARESANKRWSKSKVDANALQTQYKGNAKKERKGKEINEIPTIDLFLEYAKTITDIYKPTLDYAIKSKYQSWVENGWKDGHDKEIKNWKNTLRNTMPYLKELPKPVEELKIGEVFQPKINFY